MILKKDFKQNVLITGSTSGLGYYLSELFINDNYNVFVNGSSKPKLERAKKKLEVDGYACDVTMPNECSKLINNARKSVGNIDIIICNVGSGSSVPIGEENPKEWKRMLDLNLFSTINTIDAFIKSPQKSPSSVVCISSICGHEYVPGAPATYSVAKSALNTYIKVYSKYLEGQNINLNGLVCGNILFKGSVWDKKMRLNKNIKSSLMKDVPVKRFAKPDDIYRAIKLFTNTKNSFMSGSLLLVDGGQTRSI